MLHHCVHVREYSVAKKTFLSPEDKLVTLVGTPPEKRSASITGDRVPSKEVSPIKDIVHGYIDITPLEKIIIDSRQFQRLHFVLQNSSTYTAYPTNKNSRFAHSLGVAHVAGEMFQSAMKNADGLTLHKAFAAMAAFIDKFNAPSGKTASELKEQWARCVGHKFHYQISAETDAEMAKAADQAGGDYSDYGQQFLLNTFGSAIRVCGLVHDIGHLPMSHIFESALDEVQLLFDRYKDQEPVRSAYSASFIKLQTILAPSRKVKAARLDSICGAVGVSREQLDTLIGTLPVHEKLSLQIFDEIAEEVAASRDADKDFVNLVFYIAQAILLSNKKMERIGVDGEINPLLRGLRDIISSELDADRIDYTLRDPIESGVTDRQFDLPRLLSEMTLHFDARTEKFKLCCGYKALSVVETVFHNRFLNYRFIIYHHSVVRMNCVLEEIIRQLIRICFVDTKDHLTRVLEQHGLVKITDPDDPSTIEMFPEFKSRIIDEAWLRSLLISIVVELESGKSKKYSYLVQLINTFLFRRTNNLKTMWKSEMDFARIRRDHDGKVPGVLTAISTDEKIAVVEKITERARELNNRLFIFFMSMNPKVYEAGEQGISIIDSHGELWEAATVSPYLRSLKDIAGDSANFHISFMAPELKSDRELLAICDDVERDIIDVIAAARKTKLAA